MSQVYTKTGDRGTTSLFNGERRSKDAPHFEALGSVDEANAQIGLARSHYAQQRKLAYHMKCSPPYAQYYLETDVDPNPLPGQLEEIQSRLFDLGSHLATPRATSSDAKVARTEFSEEHVLQLERWIDAMDAELPPLKNFILPGGGNLTSATLHVARTTVRRAERCVIPLLETGDVAEVVLRYLNRLSDYLFVAARFASSQAQEPETIWRKART
jgi:cob(I)alamin adenosyltransferase